MLQAGPVINVHLPKDRVTQTHQGYGFVEFGSEDDADYACKIMNQIRLWGKPIRVNKASADKRLQGAEGTSSGVGAELFIGNLDTLADEKVLYETFSRFGTLLSVPKVARDDANLSKGYGFVSYSNFESSDQAIEHMHGQYMMNKEITVQYAYKKDGKGERHGDAAERALAAQARKHGVEVAVPAMPASLVMPSGTPSGPAAMNGGYPGQAPPGMNGMPPQAPRQTPQPPPAYGGGGGYGGYAPPPGPAAGYNAPPTPTGFGGYAPPPHLPSPVSAGHMNFGQGAGGYLPPPSSTGTIPNSGLPHQPPPQAPRQPQQQQSFNHQAPLAAPPPGLPARPPPSSAGYGGPVQGPPSGFPPAPAGLPPRPQR
jgi:splicing factor 3B subunit 4